MIAEKAYLEMYPEEKLGVYNFSLIYSGKFNDYNGNVRKYMDKIEFKLSRKWKEINEDIQIGLIQVLLNKLFKTKIQTQNTGLYEIFIKKVHIAVPKTKTDILLEDSFNRVNEKYFFGLIERPNLRWGADSLSKLGSYEYGSDTITISNIFRNTEPILLDYIMHHEMLHKKHKFYTKNGKSFHHTRNFSTDEKNFENQPEMERKIRGMLRKKRFFSGFF